MKIVYLLYTHRNERQIRRLAARLRTGSDSFLLIHHDHGKGVTLPVRGGSDVHVINDYVPVTWGDATLLLATLRGIRWLEEEKFDFDWVVTLSGQDYPVQPLHRTESFLKNTAYDGFVAHELIHEDPKQHQRYWQTECMFRYFYHYDPILRVLDRKFRLKRRHPYRNGFNCYAGSNWLNLSRTAVEYLWSKKDIQARLIRYFEKSFFPEETFFQTILLNNSELSIANDDKRFILWRDSAKHPELLCLEHLDAMVGSGDFFARKFDDSVCPEILDRLDDVVQPASIGEDRG